jgi:hypothetical protein
MPGWSNGSSITDLPIASVLVEGFNFQVRFVGKDDSNRSFGKNYLLKYFYLKIY